MALGGELIGAVPVDVGVNGMTGRAFGATVGCREFDALGAVAAGGVLALAVGCREPGATVEAVRVLVGIVKVGITPRAVGVAGAVVAAGLT